VQSIVNVRPSAGRAAAGSDRSAAWSACRAARALRPGGHRCNGQGHRRVSHRPRVPVCTATRGGAPIRHPSIRLRSCGSYEQATGAWSPNLDDRPSPRRTAVSTSLRRMGGHEMRSAHECSSWDMPFAIFQVGFTHIRQSTNRAWREPWSLTVAWSVLEEATSWATKRCLGESFSDDPPVLGDDHQQVRLSSKS